MTWARPLLTISLLLTLLYLAGCAAPQPVRTDQKTPETTTGVEQPYIQPLTKDLELALDTVEKKDYQEAVKQFDRMLKRDQEVQDEYLYDYALALSKTGREADAVTQLTTYIDSLDRRGSNFLAALALRDKLEQELARQQRQAAKDAQAAARQAQLDDNLSVNWQQVTAQAASAADTFSEPLTGIEMIRVKGGCYQMGDQFGDGESNERPVHQVCVDDFYLGRYEITQQQWQLVMGYNPSRNPNGENYPVENISWHDAVAFTDALSGEAGHYRLPTEAEWEYAARSGGQKEKFSGSDESEAVAWHEDNSGGSTHPVGQKQPNGLGFYDMSGNVYEWVLDFYAADYYQQSPVQNPAGPSTTATKVHRGGSYDSEPSYSRTSYRTDNPADQPYRKAGLRLTLPVKH